jgi:alanyl aminopeptidase
VLFAAAPLLAIDARADETARLDADVEPVFQHVDLVVDPREQSYSGRVAIDVKIERSASRIVLHAQELEITSSAVFERGETPHDARVEPLDDSRIVVIVDTPLPAGTHRIELGFTNEFDSQAVALYRVDFEGEAYAFTQFEAVEARKAFPCFDEPAFKIPWRVSITAPEGMLAFGNTPIENETSLDDGTTRHEFARTPAMSSYLVALAVGPFDTVDVPGLGRPGSIVVPKGKAHLAVDAMHITPVVLQALEAYFGTPYPYAKLDQVAVPEFWAGAMENVGLVTYRDTILLKDPERLTVGARRYLITVITHELAHMWFGNLVTMEWWDDLWLNESFATWIATKIDMNLYPELDFDIDRVREGQDAMTLDSQTGTRAVRQPVTQVVNLLQAADPLAYNKGRMVLYMFETWLGEEVFRAGVREYLTANRWGNARAIDLWDKLAEASGIDVGQAMSTFLDQPGVPVIDAELIDGGDKVRLRQSRYFSGGDRDDPTLWQIPVRLKFEDDRGVQERAILLTQRERVYDLGSKGGARWLHPNAEETGYYRWRVSGEGLTALADNAAEHLSKSEEVALYTTASIMLQSERMSGADFLATIRNLGRSPRPQSIGSLVGSLGFVRTTFIDEETEDAYAGFVRTMLQPIHDAYGPAPREGEHGAITDARAGWMDALTRTGQNEDIAEYVKAKVDAYLEDPNTVDPSMAELVLSLAARDGDEALYEAYLQRAQSAPVPSDRVRFLRNLGNFEDPELRERALAFSLEAPLPPQHVMSIAMSIETDDPEVRRMMWDWMIANYETITSKIPPPFQQYLPYAAMSCEGELLEEADAFFSEPAISVPGIAIELEKVRQFSTDCAKLAARERASVKAFLSGVAVEG